MEDTSPSLDAGTLLAGKYRVERLLGEGGMGVVVSATNEALRQRVAIKMLRSSSLQNPMALGRFEREARAAARLRSEHVARVVDIGKLEDGRPYIVMEHLEGCDLGALLDRDRPPLGVGEVVDYVLQACEAIAEAHAAGIIHRDLKPKNLFLATSVDGRPLVKVLDFGISKLESSDEEDMSLTRTTEVIGSPSYMSPEQLRASRDVDARTDLWALGVILYELLTKTVPFRAATVTELVAVVLTETAPDVRAARPDVPEGLANAISRCLSASRDTRFPDIAALVHAIAPYGTGGAESVAQRISRVAAGRATALGAAVHGTTPAIPEAFAAGPFSGTTPWGRDAMVTADTAGTSGVGGTSAIPGFGAPPGQAYTPSSPQGMQQFPSPRAGFGGGTSVAWGETHVDDGSGRRVADAAGASAPNPAVAPSRFGRTAKVASAILALGLVGVGAAAYARNGGLPFMSRSGAAADPPPAAAAAAPVVDPKVGSSSTATMRDTTGTARSGTEGQAQIGASTGAAPPLSSGASSLAPAGASGTALSPSKAPGEARRPGRPSETKSAGRASHGNAAAAGHPAPTQAPPASPPPPSLSSDDLSNIGRR